METCRHMAEIFSAMGDPNRTMILMEIARGERCVSDLATQLGISESAVSQHLRLLRTLRLVRPRRQGRNVYYALDDDHVQALLTICLEHVRGR
jgi:DNA-binding transcriptional ArsR family regulator